MKLCFLHTSDWQLGMTRAYMPAATQARYADDQIDAVRRIARLATERECAFVVVAGDVFDSIQPDRRVLRRALDALAAFTVPVYLLPGNHDHDGPAAFWSSPGVVDLFPETVHLVRDTVPHGVEGLPAEIVGAPLTSRRPERDVLGAVLAALAPAPPGVVRVAVGHGAVDSIAPDQADPALISVAGLAAAVADGRVTFVALGDRHSVTNLAPGVWYSGAPVATDYGEDDPNKALVVAVDTDDVTDPIAVEAVEIGAWRFVKRTVEVTGPESVGLLEDFLDAMASKERTVVKLALVGTVSLSTRVALDAVIDRARDLLGALDVSERRSELVVVADDADLAALDLSGFARAALGELVAVAASGDPGASSQAAGDAVTAQDALLLLHRLAARVPSPSQPRRQGRTP